MLDNFSFLYADKSKQEIEAALHQNIKSALCEKYGQQPDKAITKRVRREWHAIEVNGNIFDVAVLHELCVWMRKCGYAYWLNGSTGSSFILYLLGIAAANPLPAHYFCPKCHAVKWNNHYKSGFDLPPNFAACDNDGSTMKTDGQNIPWQTLWGYGRTPSSLDIRIAAELREPLYDFFENHWLSKLDTNIHPDAPYPEHQSLFRFSNITFDIIYGEVSGTQKVFDKNVDASCVATALENWGSLICASDETLEDVTPPETFADLVYLNGLFHSTGTWDEECEFMIDRLCYPPSDMIAFTDDVYQYMLDHDFIDKDAWEAAQSVKKGKGLPFFQEEMFVSRDRWVLSRIDAIQYLFPKAHAVEWIFFMLKTGQYSSDN